MFLPQTPPSRQPATRSDDRSRGHAHQLALAIGLCGLLVPHAWAGSDGATNWALDPVHTRVMFAVSHAGFSQALGTVTGSHGSLQFDPDDWSRTRLDVTVPLERLDLGDADWNRAVLARRLLDVQSHPQARFIVDTAMETQPGQGRVCGDLSLHGVTRPLTLDIESFKCIDNHPIEKVEVCGADAEAEFNRGDFDVNLALDHGFKPTVQLRIQVEAQRQG